MEVDQLTWQLTWEVTWLPAALAELLQLGLLVHLLLLQVLVPVGHLGPQVGHLVARVHLDGHLQGRGRALESPAQTYTSKMAEEG